MADIPDKLSQVPDSFRSIAQAINALIDYVRPLSNMEGKGGITVQVSDNNIVVTGPSLDDGEDALSSLPAGYTIEEFTICDSGTPASRWMITWTSDPSA